MQPATTVEALAGRVTASRQRRRRIRVLRNVAALLVMAVAVFLVVVWQRNTVRLETAQSGFESRAAELVRTFEATGKLPLFYSSRDSEEASTAKGRLNYVDPEMARRLQASRRPVIVAYSEVIRQIVRPDRRVVAIKDGDTIRFEVLSTRQFRAAFARQEAPAEPGAEQSADRERGSR